MNEKDIKFWSEVSRDIMHETSEVISPLIGTEKGGEIVKMGADGTPTKLIDLVAEDKVVEILEATGRPVTLISEEIGEHKIGEGASEVVFVVDPLDGTSNAVKNIPAYGISIAVADASKKSKTINSTQSGTANPSEMESNKFKDSNVHDLTIRDIELGFVKNIATGDVYEGVSRLMKAPDGGYYGVPFHAWVQGIWYKANLFEERDLGAPTSWYNILTAAKALNDPANGFYGLILPKKADAYTEQVFSQIALSNGARPIDRDGNILFNTPEMIESFRFYKELGKYSKPGFTSVPAALNGYLNNEAAMVFYSTYIMDDIAVEEVQKQRVEQFDPKLVENTGFANFMVNIRPSSFGEVVGLGILNTSDNKDAAEQWVKFLMSGNNYIYWLHMAPGGMNPTRSSIAQMDEFLDNPVLERYGKDQITTIISALDTVERFEFMEGEIIEEMSILSGNFVVGRAINLMFANDWTPQQTAQWAQKEAERLLGY